MSKFGNAAIIWTDTSVGTERILLLDAPLRSVRPGFSRTAYTAESLDKTAIATVTVGSGAHELVGLIRYEDDPQGLLDMIQAGATNTTLTYIPSLSDPDTSYVVKLIEPRNVERLALELDGQRATFGEMQVEVRFRQTDQTAFTEVYGGTPVLWSFRAGQSILSSEFARAGTAYYASKGSGTLTSSATGARIHYTDVNADGVRETPGLLLEGARTNICIQSQDFSTWTSTGTPVLTANQSDPYGTTTAYLIEDDDAGAAEYKLRAITFTGDGDKAVSVWAKAGTATASVIRLQDNTAAVARMLATVTWTNGAPSVAMTNGTLLVAERWRDGWYRFMFRATGVVAANVNQFRLYGANTTVTAVGSTYYFGAQCEDALYPSSYIPTVLVSVARVRDSYEVPFTARVQTLTFYARYLSRGAEGRDASDRTVMAIGNSGANTRVQIEQAGSASAFRVTLGDTTSTVTSGTVSNTATIGQPVEVLCVLTVTPATLSATATLTVSINGVTTTGTASSAKAVSDFFQGNELALNATPGSTTTDWNAAYTHAGVIRGSVDILAARRLLRVS